jgi:peptide/nickel transport system permease protein
VVLLITAIIAIIAPYVAPHDPYSITLANRYAPPGDTYRGEQHLLGTDQVGRDVLSRLLYGARISLTVAFASVGIGVTLGAILGIVTAYVGGPLDLLVQRVVDSFMAFPALILALGIMAFLGASLNNVILTLVVLFLPGACRIVRSEALSIKEVGYIESARAIGSSGSRIVFRHLLPNCMAPYIVFATANLGFAIVIEAALSFLGVGTPPDVPSWGAMLSVAGQKYIEVSPWLLIFPSLAISLVVFGLNLFGDALRDTLDPRLRGMEVG